MNVWRLISFEDQSLKETVTQSFINNNRIAIGWGEIGHLENHTSPHSISHAITAIYPDKKNSHIGGPTLWHFYQNVKIGDLVIIDASKSWSKVVEVTGEYEWNDLQPNIVDYGNYYHQRPIKVRDDISPEQLLKIIGKKPAIGDNQRWVLFYYGSFVQQLRNT